jgi:hypothetical protein
MFDALGDKLEQVFKRLRGHGKITERHMTEALREVRMALLEADVNFQLTREFLERVEKKATGVNALSTVSPGQQLVKIVHEELTAMLGEQREGLKLGTVPPSVVMMVGLQGSGKTTTAAKLALKLKAGSIDSPRRCRRLSPGRHRSTGDAGPLAFHSGVCRSHHDRCGEDRARRRGGSAARARSGCDSRHRGTAPDR